MKATSLGRKAFSLFLIVALVLPTISPTLAQAANTASAWSTSPFNSPQGTPTSPRFRMPALALRVTSAPDIAQVGEAVTYTVRLANEGNDVVHGVIVSGTLPAGLDCTGCGNFYSPGNRKLQWTWGGLDEGQAVTITFSAQVGEGAAWEGGTALRLSARGVEVPRSTRGRAVVRTPYPLPDTSTQVIIPQGQSGQLISADGRLTVTFPAEAVATTLTVSYSPTLAPAGEYYHLLRHFHLNAYDPQGQEVHVFPAPIEISFSYIWAEVLGVDPSQGFQLSRWDDDLDTWEYIPAEADVERQLITAQTEHLSEFAIEDEYIKLPSDDYLPQLQGFQEIDLFSGAASYSYPIDVPPGRGGLTPQLSLSYSSGSVDWPARAWDPELQAGWVGYGWSLDVAYIGRQDVGGKMVDPETCEKGASFTNGVDVYNLVLNGASHDLVRGLEEDTHPVGDYPIYHTMDETFWRIWPEPGLSGEQSPERWRVQTKDGTIYTFSEQLWQQRESDGYDEVYKWLLTEVRDPYDNVIQYTYYVEKLNCPGAPNYDQEAEAFYPAEIKYNFHDNEPLTRIEFIRGNRTDVYAPIDLNRCPSKFVQKEKLDFIKVWMSDELVREYELHYDYTTYDDSGEGDGKLTLKSVQMCGPQDGIETRLCYPATTFTYHPMKVGPGESLNPGRNRLMSVSNGFGGRVTYHYETVSEIHGSRNRVVSRQVEDGLGNAYTWSYDYSEAKKNTPYNEFVVACQDGISADAWVSRHRSRVDQEFRGHEQVTVTDPKHNVQVHRFHQDDVKRGKEAETLYLDSQDNLLRRVARTYAYIAIDVAPSGEEQGYCYAYPESAFPYVEEEVEYICEGAGGGVDCQQRTSRYYYDPAGQEGEQFGNLTRIEEYGSLFPVPGATPMRTTYRHYRPNTEEGAWIVGLVEQEFLFAGAYDPASRDVSNWQSATYYVYEGEDGQENPFQPPETTTLRRVLQVKELDGDWVATTVDTAYTYDDYGNRVSKEVFSDEGRCQAYPDGLYAPASVSAGLTTIEYNVQGGDYHLYPERVTYPNSELVEEAKYDYRLGVLLWHTDMNDIVTQYRYDDLGRLVKLWKDGDSESLPTTQVWYENWGQPTQQRVRVQQREVSGAGGTLDQEQYFDGLGRKTQVHQEAGGGQEVIATTLYGPPGQVEAELRPYFHPATLGYVDPGADPCAAGSGYFCTQYEYDALGRTTLVTNPDGTTVETIYEWWNTKVIDANGHQLRHDYDALGRLIFAREYIGDEEPYTLYAETAYEYDVRDLLEQVTDDAGNQTILDYDKLGRKTSMQDPDMGDWTYAYNTLGNMTRQTDARGQRVCLYYDVMNRLIGKHYRSDDNCPSTLPSTPDVVRYKYDETQYSTPGDNYGLGRRTGMEDNTGSTSWLYDSRGRVIEETKQIVFCGGTHTFTTGWEYDTMNRLRVMKYPAGTSPGFSDQVTYSYNARGLLDGLTSSPDIYVNEMEYDAAGRLTTMGLGADVLGTNVLTRTYTYYDWDEQNGRLQGTSTESRPGGTIQDLQYAYDPVGNVDWIDDYVAGSPDPERQDFSYDPLDRLIHVSVTGGNHSYNMSYTYNTIGNLWISGQTHLFYGTQSASCPDGALNKPHAVVSAAIDSFCYDHNGNQTQRNIFSTGTGTFDLTYDEENHLVGVDNPGTGSHATFIYDGDGNRVIGTVDGETTFYIGDHYEYNPAQPYERKLYYYANGKRIAMRRLVGAERIPEGYFYWLLDDHLGSTAVVTDEEGNLYSEIHYKPYGKDWYDVGDPAPTTYRFTGQRVESSLGGLAGLYDYKARWYDPYLHRFIQADSIVPSPGDPQSLNRYSYVRNNPLLYTDPSGHAEVVDEEGNWVANPRTGWISWRGFGRPKLPSSRYLYSEEYGYFDKSHLDTGKPGQVIEDAKAAIGAGGDTVYIKQSLKKGGVSGTFVGTYEISGQATPEQAEGIALGIYQDWSVKFELWESSFWGLLGTRSGFANEDLPSHYVGFYAEATGTSRAEVLMNLGAHGTSDVPPHGMLPHAAYKNYSFTPRIQNSQGNWGNVPWPDEMTVTPIGSQTGLWSFQQQDCNGALCIASSP